MQTNGTLLNDEWGAFLAQNHVLVRFANSPTGEFGPLSPR